MRKTVLGKLGAGVMLVFLLLVPIMAQAATVDLFDYMIPTPLKRWCNYTYLSPVGFSGFTLRVSPITSGKYAGKYYWGDWNLPGNETDAWRIISWDATQVYMWASQLGGDFPNAVIIPRIPPLDTIVPTPTPDAADYPWYYTFRSSLTVPAGTFNDVLLDLALDINYPPNSMNAYLGLNSIPAITYVTYYAKGIGEIWNADIDAATGDIRYNYVLVSTGVSSSLPALPLLLMD